MSNGILPILVILNGLLETLALLQIPWSKVRAAIDRAQAEGRPLGLQDLVEFRQDAEARLDELRETLHGPKTPPE